jgi:hypothetical protein
MSSTSISWSPCLATLTGCTKAGFFIFPEKFYRQHKLTTFRCWRRFELGLLKGEINESNGRSAGDSRIDWLGQFTDRVRRVAPMYLELEVRKPKISKFSDNCALYGDKGRSQEEAREARPTVLFLREGI